VYKYIYNISVIYKKLVVGELTSPWLRVGLTASWFVAKLSSMLSKPLSVCFYY